MTLCLLMLFVYVIAPKSSSWPFMQVANTYSIVKFLGPESFKSEQQSHTVAFKI